MYKIIDNNNHQYYCYYCHYHSQKITCITIWNFSYGNATWYILMSSTSIHILNSSVFSSLSRSCMTAGLLSHW